MIDHDLSERIAVSLRFSGDELNPDEVSTVIGSQPTRAYRKGDPRTSPNGTCLGLARFGLWSLSISQDQPGDLEAKIVALLGATTQDLSRWHVLTGRLRAELFCGVFMPRMNWGINLSPAIQLAIGQRGLELDLDIYAADVDDSLPPQDQGLA